MSVQIPCNSIYDRFHSQPVVSKPSHRSVHAFQAETPEDLGLPAHLCEQIVEHFVLLSVVIILRSTVSQSLLAACQKWKCGNAIAALGRFLRSSANNAVSVSAADVEPPATRAVSLWPFDIIDFSQKGRYSRSRGVMQAHLGF